MSIQFSAVSRSVMEVLRSNPPLTIRQIHDKLTESGVQTCRRRLTSTVHNGVKWGRIKKVRVVGHGEHGGTFTST